jgi:competence protein ComEC
MPAELPAGEAYITIADVGQGTGIVVETRRHTLIYDAGPLLGRTDGAEAALLPVLRRRGRERVDLLMVSHADADHAGGLGTLLASDVEIRRISAGEPLDGAPEAQPCRRGQQWQWDRVSFAVLHPGGTEEGNDASCVLRITSASGVSALLPGDISAAVERRLVERHGEELQGELLLAPHHGSASSSSPGFISRVAPLEAVFTAGYRNRYGLPDEDVVRRYLLAGAAVRKSAVSGALGYRLADTLTLDEQYRRSARRYFHGR